MRITIVQGDGLVGVGGDFRRVDLSALPVEIRAVQYDTARGRGVIEYDAGATKKVSVRDEAAEAIAYAAALASVAPIFKLDAEGRESAERDLKAEDLASRPLLAALEPIYRELDVPREPEPIDSAAWSERFAQYLTAWEAAAPPPPAGPSAEQIREAKRAIALRKLDDRRLAQAAAEGVPLAEVLDYVAAVGGADQIGVVDALPELDL